MCETAVPLAGSRATRLLAGAALAVSLALAFAGIRWGTFVAGGSDSYCYVGQALAWASGTIREPQVTGFDLPWPSRELALSPTGFVPSRVVPGGIAPMCPPGLALVMAAFWKAGGLSALFLVVPLLGAAMTWGTFLVGRQLAGPGVGLLAAALAATSPIVLYQVVQPMSDVPAAAWSVLALAAVAGPGLGRAAAAGVAAALAVLTRPNLAPLPAVLVIALLLRPLVCGSERGAGWRQAVVFLAGLLPGIALLAWIQSALHGSMFRTGYGDLDLLFSLSNVTVNGQRYWRWLLESETPAILLALAGPFVATRVAPDAGGRVAWSRWLAATMVAAVIAIVVPYLLYVPWEAWWYLRFLLPAIPLVLVFVSVAVLTAARRLPAPPRTVVVLVFAFALMATRVEFARSHYAFDLVNGERRFVAAGEYIGSHLPARAVVLTVWHSGSVRLYGRRLTISWDALDAEWLDPTLNLLRQGGHPPYLLLERAEEAAFRARFGAASRVGGLDWPPRAEIGTTVRLYDPEDRTAFLSGQPVTTERVWLNRPATGLRGR